MRQIVRENTCNDLETATLEVVKRLSSAHKSSTSAIAQGVSVFLVLSVFSTILGAQPQYPAKEYIRLGGRVIAIESGALEVISTSAIATNEAQNVQFTARYAGVDVSGAVDWTISAPNVGAISTTGVFTAVLPINTPLSAIVTASTRGGTPISASKAVLATPGVRVLGVTPAAVLISAAGTPQAFTASLSGVTQGFDSVTWSVTSGPGTVSPAGVYLSPSSIPTAQTARITATSKADPSKSATAVVTLQPPTVSGLPIGWSSAS